MNEELLKNNRFIEAVGRRKTAVARVRISKTKDAGDILINGKDYKDFLPKDISYYHTLIKSPLLTDELKKLYITIIVKGGGVTAQVEAIRNGLAKAIVDYIPEQKPEQKKLGFLKRDHRIKERKKPGLKKARKAPQWSKR